MLSRYQPLIRKVSLIVSVFIAFFLIFTLLLVGLVGRTPPNWFPEPLTNWLFDVRLIVVPTAKKALSVAQGSLIDNRIYLDNSGQDVVFDNEELTLAATLYYPDLPGNIPGVLLLHGSTPEGRNLGLYRLLGKELANRGYIVLNVDQRGFGDSDDPPRADAVDAFDPIGDAKKMLDYLSSVEGVDTEQLIVIGHSGGANVAIAAGIEDSRIREIVAIGPPLRSLERFGSVDSPEWEYFQRRTMRYMDLDQPIPNEFSSQPQRELLPLESYLEYFTSEEHKPLLLIDGMLDPEEDRRYLQDACNEISEPKNCFSLPNAGHYANVANWGALIIYDERAFGQLVDEIDSWLSDVSVQYHHNGNR